MITINDNKLDWNEGLTVGDTLKIMGYDYALIATTVNDQFVPQDDYCCYKIPDQANVKVLHICHGG